MSLRLMIPGPIEVETCVLEALSQPVQAHYGATWVEAHNETIALLQRIFGTQGRVFMLPGSGSLAGDAAVHTLFAPGQRVALGINGHFGHRWREILEANGVEPVIIECPPEQPLAASAFDDLLCADPALDGVCVVHLETSTAVLNPVQEIAAVCRAHDKLLVVDAVSSLAGTPLPMDDWGVDVCVAASQKSLGGVAGLGLVAVNDRAWAVIERRPADGPAAPQPVHSWYLDLRRWQWYVENWGDWHPFPVTMPTSVILALRAALRSLAAQGLETRLAQYEARAERLRGRLTALGLRLFAPPELMAPVLTAVWCPPGIRSSELVAWLAERHNIKITNGFGPLKEQVFRIGHMGNALTQDDLDTLTDAIGEFLAERVAA